MKVTREIKTGILASTTILLFIWGYSFVKGQDILNDYRTFYVQYDNVEGLSPSANVTINGLIVGKVAKISLDEKSGKLTVQLQLKTDFPISKSSTAVIYKPGFIDGKQIAIHPNLLDKSESKNGQMLLGSSELDLTASIRKELIPMQDKFQHVMQNADDLLIGVNNVLDTKGQQDLKVSLAELGKTLEQFHKASVSINAMLEQNKSQVSGVVGNLNKVSANFASISDSLRNADLGKTIVNLKKTLDKVDLIMHDLQSGQGSMGKLLKDEKLYTNLTKSTKELELLLQDVRLHPTRYVNVSVFGKKEKPYVLPAKDSI